MSTLWQGRFDGDVDPAAQRFTASIELDRLLADHDVRYSRAHVRALGRAGLLSPQEVEELVEALEQVGRELAAGALPLEVALEDVHTHVERRVTELTGDTGAKLHTGRSRNDQVATDMRLFLRDAVDDALDRIRHLQRALVDRASEHVDTILPAYSHMQRAQPVSLTLHLLAHVWMLERDRGRLDDARARFNRCPAGAGASSGTGIPLARETLASDLDFDTPTENALDTVCDRDFVVEFLSAAALCLAHTGRLAADLCLWATAEFGFVRVPLPYCTGSSMMPQKVNPDVLELVRGKAAAARGDLVTMLGLLHALPLGYHRDYQEDKGPMLRGAANLLSVLEILPPLVSGLEFDVDRMAAAASDPGLLATDWAEELVTRGVPFRRAHGAVGELMRLAAEEGTDPRKLEHQRLESIHPELPEALAAVPDAAAAVARKSTSGSTGEAALRQQLARAEAVAQSP